MMTTDGGGLGDFRARAWRAIGGDEEALGADVSVTAMPALASVVPCGDLLAHSVALAALSIQSVQRDRGQVHAYAPVGLDGSRLTASAQCERHLRIDGVAPEVWAPLSGFWRAADGWVRTHGNYPHHAVRLSALLGLGADADRERAAAAIAAWPAVDLETEAARIGAIVGAVRPPEIWAAHPEAAAVAADPLISVQPGTRPAGRMLRDPATAPLGGIRVLDLTRVLAGPVATRDLAFAGADVLRVDSPRLPEIGWQHLETGHGKRSATLDLDDPTDRRRFEELLARADVVVTGYRPGSLDRYGLSPEALTERRPELIVGTVGAWSANGPWAARRGFDSIVQAVTGLALTVSDDGATPNALPAQVLDHSAGHLLAAGICAALVRRRRDGVGTVVRAGLARLAHELLGAPAMRDAEASPGAETTPIPAEPAVQTGRGRAGVVTTALPPFRYPGGPDEYPELASPWGEDDAAWC